MKSLNAAFAGLALLASTMTGIVRADDETPDRLDIVQKKGAIEFIVYRDFPPYSFEKDGAFAGVDVDMGHALAAKLGLKAGFRTFIPGEDLEDDLRNHLWRGTIVGGSVGDVMLHVGADPQYVARQDKVSIFGVYFREAIAVSFDPKRFGRYTTLDDLEGHKVGVELGSLADQYLTNFRGGAIASAMQRYPTLAEAARDYCQGKLDGAIAPRGELQGLMHDNGCPEHYAPPQALVLQGIYHGAWELGIAVKKDSPKLRDALAGAMAALIESGEMKAIYARHGMDYATPGQR